MAQQNNSSTESASIFTKLSRRYLIALSLLALTILLSQGLIQGFLKKQTNDSRVINVAGRQRMLCQKIAKQVLQIDSDLSFDEKNKLQKELEETLKLWTSSHEGLKNRSTKLELSGENSKSVKAMFEEIGPPYQLMVDACQKIQALLQSPPTEQSATQFRPLINQVLENENTFLTGMNDIVFQYDWEAKNKVLNLGRIEFFLLLVALGALLLELLLIFRPTAVFVQKTVERLTLAEQEAKDKALEITQLFEAKEQSVQELRALNFAVDQATLFASISLDGRLIYMSEKLITFLGYKNAKPKGQFTEVLTQNEEEQEYLFQIIRTPRSEMWTGEVAITTVKQKKCWLELSIVPIHRSGVKQDYLILCSDITVRKQAELELKKLNQEKFKEEIRLQKLRSSHVVEAQEKERERIAKDMHDGIGQMLTALKFNIESLNPDHPEKLTPKIDGLKKLSSDLIKGVRIATFNLTPPELTDYGVSMALAKLCKELGRLTGQNILFENKTQFDQRLDSIVETNIYRITQEAVNNAVKYAKADYVLVTISHSKNMMSIMIDDDGIGFDKEEISKKEVSEMGSNMGLTFMQERVTFISGRLFIRSTKGEGTRITINVPLNGNT